MLQYARTSCERARLKISLLTFFFPLLFFSGSFLAAESGVPIENFFKLEDGIYSGGSPDNEAAFVSLEKIGIKTIITVDGMKPNVELAHKHGMRYIHLPHGYDGIPAATQAKLIKAAQTAPGPIYIHCHHGKHRGPAAAAIICMGTKSWSTAQSKEWLGRAGTSTNYAGLWKAVADFKMPDPVLLSKMPANFPEVAPTTTLVDSMVAIDQQWDKLQLLRKNGYQAPAESPDLEAANEATIFYEQFQELSRLQPNSSALKAGFKEVARQASELKTLFSSASMNTGPLDEKLDQISRSCAECHKKLRDNPKPQILSSVNAH